MADDKKKDDKKGKKKAGSGGMSFGLEILLFLLAIFIIWVLMGKPQSEDSDKPFIRDHTTSSSYTTSTVR